MTLEVLQPLQLMYLIGPITDVSYGGSTDWRKYVAEKLPPHILPVSPMRNKEYLSAEKKIGMSYEEIPLSSARGIVCRDRNDVIRCNLAFANLTGAKQVSIGSVLELGGADILRKPIIVVMEEGNIHQHAMICEMANFVIPDLDEAIELAVKILSVGV